MDQVEIRRAREVVVIEGLIQGTRDGKHDLVLASLKEIKVLMACDSAHKKQAHLTGLLLDLESTSRRLRDFAIRGTLTVPWRGEGVVSSRATATEDPKKNPGYWTHFRGSDFRIVCLALETATLEEHCRHA